MLFRVFGVEFKNKKELFQSLKYTAMQSQAFVVQKYGSYEEMIKTRLQLTDDDAIKEKLIALRDNYRKTLKSKVDTEIEKEKDAPVSTSGVLTDSCDAHVKALLRVLIASINKDKKKELISLVATSLAVSAEELTQKLETFLA